VVLVLALPVQVLGIHPGVGLAEVKVGGLLRSGPDQRVGVAVVDVLGVGVLGGDVLGGDGLGGGVLIVLRCWE
jgi:hypothetical protein